MEVVEELAAHRLEIALAWFGQPVEAQAILVRLDHGPQAVLEALLLSGGDQAFEGRFLDPLPVGLTALGHLAEPPAGCGPPGAINPLVRLGNVKTITKYPAGTGGLAADY